jgi:hypothetical protein
MRGEWRVRPPALQFPTGGTSLRDRAVSTRLQKSRCTRVQDDFGSMKGAYFPADWIDVALHANNANLTFGF